jgi:hypothetical protein
MKPKWIGWSVAALVVGTLAGYAIYWYVVAPKVDAAIDDWVAMQRQAGLTLEFQRTPVAGFPWEFRSIFRNPHVAGSINGQPVEWQGAALELSLSPFDLETIRFSAAGHHRVDLGAARYTLDAAALNGALAFRDDGTMAKVDAEGESIKLELPNGTGMSLDGATIGLTLPEAPPRSDQESAADFSVDATNVALPAGTTLLTADPLTTVRIAGSIKGPIPAAPLSPALAAWSNQGGTLEVKAFTLAQPPLTLTGSATLALDQDLQPIGAANMTARGLGETIDLLARQGRLAAGDATKFKLFVKGAQSPGADGVPEVATGLSLQNGYLSWGPFRLARMPRITWP